VQVLAVVVVLLLVLLTLRTLQLPCLQHPRLVR
jgi:hypothetical protein